MGGALEASEASGSLSDPGASPLYRAAGSGPVDLCECLLNARAHVNLPNDEGATPMDAARRVHGGVVGVGCSLWIRFVFLKMQ